MIFLLCLPKFRRGSGAGER